MELCGLCRSGALPKWVVRQAVLASYPRVPKKVGPKEGYLQGINLADDVELSARVTPAEGAPVTKAVLRLEKPTAGGGRAFRCGASRDPGIESRRVRPGGGGPGCDGRGGGIVGPCPR